MDVLHAAYEALRFSGGVIQPELVVLACLERNGQVSVVVRTAAPAERS